MDRLIVPKWNPEIFEIKRFENNGKVVLTRDNRVDPIQYFGEIEISNGVTIQRRCFPIPHTESLTEAFASFGTYMDSYVYELKRQATIEALQLKDIRKIG